MHGSTVSVSNRMHNKNPSTKTPRRVAPGGFATQIFRPKNFKAAENFLPSQKSK